MCMHIFEHSIRVLRWLSYVVVANGVQYWFCLCVPVLGAASIPSCICVVYAFSCVLIGRTTKDNHTQITPHGVQHIC